MKDGNTYITVIILAAGESKRMGKQKLMLPFRQSTILEQVVKGFSYSNLFEIIVVLGQEYQEITKLKSLKLVHTLLNKDYKQGMSASIIAGVKAVHKDTKGIMIALADMPFIEQSIIDCMINTYMEKGKGIIVPACNGRRGHPVIFSTAYRNELLTLKGDEGGRRIIETHPEDVFELEVGSDTVTRDIDTPEDYLRNIL
jgi:molybdenum cofactor cytidylyltransferase